jgi:GNAT superfamily N-acetyltransferase
MILRGWAVHITLSGEEMTIRRYRPGEEEALRQLYTDTTRHIIGRHYTPEQVERWVSFHSDVEGWAERIRDRNPFVAERNGEILGFAELKPDGEIDYFYCHHGHQREGVGTGLYNVIEAEARRLGIRCLHAAVSVTAKPFFVRMGFEVMKEQQNIVCGTVAPNSIMEKRLSDNKPSEATSQ